MPTTYSWKINSIATHPEPVDGSDGVIVQISASRIATDGTNTVQDARVITWTPADLSSPFIPLADVTEADVIGWVEASEADNGVVWVGQTKDEDGNILEQGTKQTSLDRTDADLAQQLESAAVAPEDVPLPWAAEEDVAA
jgi:hypothetical protein